ncbi:MAG: tetratricopeptide repeat protein [Myxococcota bacterium]
MKLPETKADFTGLARVLLAAVLGGLLIAAPATLAAQEEEEKEEKTVQVDEADASLEKERPSLEEEEEQPSVDAESFISDREEQSQTSRRLLDQQIVELKKLIDSTSSGDPKRAKYLFALSEKYWDKSKSYEMEAFAKQDECYQIRDKGDEQGHKRCQQRMQMMLDESKRLRKEAVKRYADIIQNYPDFKERDKVLYYLGNNLQQIGKQDQALDIFKRLISEYPNTQYVPDVLLAFGEYYYNEKEDVQSALKAYKKLKEYPNSTAYAYARYKEAWCYFNMDEKDRAIDTFLEVIDYSRKHPEHPNSKSLINQSQKDLVRTYAHVGVPEKALPFIKRITKGSEDEDKWLKLAERLAIHYGDMGKIGNSTRMYRILIKTNNSSAKTIDYQYEIVRNKTAENAYSQETIKELVRLMKLVQFADSGKFDDADQPFYKKSRERVDALIREWSTVYHRQAQKTKNPDLYAMSYYLYKYYLETFPETPKKYQMTFFYGELLYKLEKWEEAAAAYEQALDLKPEGKYTKDAAHAAVLSYFKIVDTSEEQAKIDESSTAKVDEEEQECAEDDEECKQKQAAAKEPPKPKEIPELHKKLINACKRYVELLPDGERIVDVKYTIARTYYDHNHLEKSGEMFKNIAYNHSDHRLSVIAANLHLDTINLRQDFDQLADATKEYLDKRPVEDEMFMEDVEALYTQIRFKKCTIHDDEENWKEAAQCFVQYYRDFPDSDYVDKALYNAALDFERMKELGKAIQVRVFLLKARPQSDLVPDTLYNIGGNYHALAVYSQAAKFYELYVKNFEKGENAEDALANASTFRQGLGQYDRAIQNYQKYLELYGKQNPEKAAEVAYQVAKIYETQDKPKEAFEQYRSFIKEFGDSGNMDRVLQAHSAVAMYYWEQDGERNRKRALKKFEETLDVYKDLGEEAQQKLTKGRDAAAQAKFMLGEDVYEDMAAITVKASDEEELQELFTEKMEVAEKAQKIFEEVIRFGRPDWAIAALYRIGSQYQNFANTIRNSPVPDRLSVDQEEIYKGLLEDKASIVEQKAIDAYARSLEVAKRESWFNEYSKKAQIELGKLDPKNYRKPSELRAEPNHFNPGFARSEFIEKVKEEDRLRDLGGGTTTTGEDAAEEASESGPQASAE